MLAAPKFRKHSNEMTPSISLSQSKIKKASKENSPNSSFQPHFISDKELNELDEYLNKKQAEEPEPEKHVKINVRSSLSKATNILSFQNFEEEDPDYIANLVFINQTKENQSRGIYFMTAGSNLDNEFVFGRYDVPFFSNKTNFHKSSLLNAASTPENVVTDTKNDDSDEENSKGKPKNKYENVRRKTHGTLKNNLLEQIKKEENGIINPEYNFLFHGRKYLFPKNSLYLFSETNRFRLFLLWILTSEIFKWAKLCVLLLNITAFMLIDYSERIYSSSFSVESSLAINVIARYYLEIFCYGFFTIELIFGVIAMGAYIDSGSYFRDPWRLVYSIILLISWCTYITDNLILELCMIIRLTGPIRIMNLFEPLKTNLNSFVKALASVYKVFLAIFSLMFFYSVVGLYFFYGLEENRCRLTPGPVNNVWAVDSQNFNLCGNWNCNSGYCGNPADFNLPLNETEISDMNIDLNYGMSRFSNLLQSLMTMFDFIDAIGWSSIIYSYWKATNNIVCIFFFTSILIFGGLICTNILLASLYESFINASSIKHALKKDLTRKRSISSGTLLSPAPKINLKLFSSFQLMAAANVMTKNRISKHSVVEKLFNFKFYEKALNAFITANMNHDKFIMKLRAKLAYFFHYNEYWLSFLHLIIFLNIIVLALDRYPIDYKTKETIQLLDFIIFLIYFIEICLKLIVFGPFLYFKSGFNIIDFMIVLLNTLQYIYEAVLMNEEVQIENTFSHFLTMETILGNLVKTSKVLRIIRSVYYSSFRSFAVLLNGLVGSLAQLKYFGLVLMTFAVIASLIGKRLFSYRIRFLEEDGPHLLDPRSTVQGYEPRINYDTNLDAIIGIFVALYNEEWHTARNQHYIGVGYKALLFYYTLIVIGQMTCVTLFSALFLNAFIKHIKHKLMNVESLKILSLKNFKILMIAYIRKVNNFIKRKRLSTMKFPHSASESRASILFGGHKFKSSDYLKKVRDSHFQRLSIINNGQTLSPVMRASRNSLIMKRRSGITIKEIKSPVSPLDKSVNKMSALTDHAFNDDIPFFYANGTFEFIGEILSHRYFENFMIFMTVASMIVIAMESPIENPFSSTMRTLDVLEFIFVTIYFLEFILKIMIFGAFKGKRSYFQESFYNFVDFLNVILSIAALFEDKNVSRDFHMCKIIRCFRVIKFAGNVNKDMQIITTALVQAFPNIMKVLLFMVVFLFILSIYSMKYLKGSMFKCINLMITDKLTVQSFIQTKTDCFDYGGDWINSDLNYDNIVNSFFSLFQIVSGEGWSLLMYNVIDAIKVDRQPEIGYNKTWSFFFIISFFIGKILLINMFVGIIIENIMLIRDHQEKLDTLSDEQKEWAHIKLNILKMKPKKKKKYFFANKLIVSFLNIFKSQKISFFFDTIIVLNIVAITIFWNRQDQDLFNTMNTINIIFIFIICFETCIEIISCGPVFFTKFSKIYDFLIVLLSLINIALQMQTSNYVIKYTNQEFHFYRFFNGVAKGMQITKIHRMLRRFQTIKQLRKTISNILPLFWSLLLFLFLVLYMYSIIFLNTFAFLKPQKTINGYDVHFKTFEMSLFSLLRISLGEVWYLVLSDMAREQSPNFICFDLNNYNDFTQYGFMGCGSKWAYLYTFLFHLTFSLILFNLFIAAIITAYGNEAKAQRNAVSRYQLDDIKNKWNVFDSDGLGYLNYKDFWQFSSQIALVLGVPSDDLLDINNKKDFLKILKIPIYENVNQKIYCYKFHDVIIALCKMSVILRYGVKNLEKEEFLPESLKKEKKLRPERKNTLNSKSKLHDLLSWCFEKKNEKTFIKTSYYSGDMASIILVQRRIKYWVCRVRKIRSKDSAGIQEDGEDEVIFDILKLTRAALKQKHMTMLQQKQESIKTEVNNNNIESDSKLEKPMVEGDNNCDTGRALIANYLDD